jgi:hypothetical protein
MLACAVILLHTLLCSYVPITTKAAATRQMHGPPQPLTKLRRPGGKAAVWGNKNRQQASL